MNDKEITDSFVRAGKQTGETISWHTKSLESSNACCVYCGVPLNDSSIESDKEHLIAREFVPTGTLDGKFNFIFRACRPCNARKADVERHVSSVTLFNSPSRAEDKRVNDAACRKGQGDFHPRKKGVRIQDAHEQTSVDFSLGIMSMSFGMVAPPQLDRNQAAELAFSHIQGLFSLLCTEDYRDPLKMRLLPQEQFILHGSYPHNDWGNPQAMEIAHRVSDWECLANIDSADGFFKAIMRLSDEGWFWALEWNKQVRLLGGISNLEMKLFNDLPNEKWLATPQGRARKNVPLGAKDDHLFHGIVCD